MVYIDIQHREVTLKLVYYGPALSGKTTNLQQLHELMVDHTGSELITLDTRDDRTLFFDLLPLQFDPLLRRRDLGEGFLSYYDETKFLAHRAVEERIAAGDPIVIAMPGVVYGPGDIAQAHTADEFIEIDWEPHRQIVERELRVLFDRRGEMAATNGLEGRL